MTCASSKNTYTNSKGYFVPQKKVINSGCKDFWYTNQNFLSDLD